jgi:hypothetical protein
MLLGSAKAQVKDSAFINFNSTTLYIGNAGTEFKNDTIPVFLLVCDTLHYSNYTPQLNPNNYFDKAGTPTWVSAFAIRKITIEKAGNHFEGDIFWFNEKDVYHYSTIGYLDSHYKPLSKYIIVIKSF